MTSQSKRQPKKKDKVTKIDYTLEQYQAEQKRREHVDELLDKMASVMEKFETTLVLHDYRIKKLEKKFKGEKWDDEDYKSFKGLLKRTENLELSFSKLLKEIYENG